MGFVFALVFVVFYAVAIGVFIGGIVLLVGGIAVVKNKKKNVEDVQTPEPPVYVNDETNINRKKPSFIVEIILIIIGLPFIAVGIGIIVVAGAVISIVRKKRKYSNKPKKKISTRKTGRTMCVIGSIMIIAPIALRVGVGIYSSDYQEGYVDTGVMCKKVESDYLGDDSKNRIQDGHFIISFDYKGEKYVNSEELSRFKNLEMFNIYDVTYVYHYKEVVANIKYRNFLYFLVGAQEHLNVYKVENETDYTMLFIYYDFGDVARIYVPEKHKNDIENYYAK